MHWVDRICLDYGLSINELARLSGIPAGTMGMAKKRNTKISDIKYSNIVKMAYKLNTLPEVLVIKYD